MYSSPLAGELTNWRVLENFSLGYPHPLIDSQPSPLPGKETGCQLKLAAAEQ